MYMNKVKHYLQQHTPVFTPAVVGYCIRGNDVLLGLRKQSSVGLGLQLIAGLGGKVGDSPECKHETHFEALVRELREEVGIEVQNAVEMGNVQFIFPDKPKWTMDTKIYLIDEWNGEPTESEDILPLWYPKHALPWNQMFSDNPLWLPRVLLGEKIQAVMLHREEVESLFF